MHAHEGMKLEGYHGSHIDENGSQMFTIKSKIPIHLKWSINLSHKISTLANVHSLQCDWKWIWRSYQMSVAWYHFHRHNVRHNTTINLHLKECSFDEQKIQITWNNIYFQLRCFNHNKHIEICSRKILFIIVTYEAWNIFQ